MTEEIYPSLYPVQLLVPVPVELFLDLGLHSLDILQT